MARPATVDVLPGVHGAGLGLPGETGLDRYRLAHRALPGRDLAEVSLRTRFLGAELAAPVLLVGADARTACEHRLGLIGNDHAPDRPPLWLASSGVGGLGAAERLVSSLEADGLVVHLDGTAMRGVGEAIAAVVERLAPLPVIARGAGLGLDPADVRELAAAGVAAIDVGGADVPGWGVPTADALAEAVLVAPGLPVLAEAASGLDAAKCLALGASAVTVASGEVEPLLQALRVATWSTGALGPADLTPGHLRLAVPPPA